MMARRRFPPPWTVEDIGGCFVVKASNDRPLVFIYYGEGVGRRSLARLLSRDAARWIAANIAKLPELDCLHTAGTINEAEKQYIHFRARTFLDGATRKDAAFLKSHAAYNATI